MINIYTSRKLEAAIKPIKLDKEIVESNQSLNFNAHIFLIDRKKCIFFTQKETCYSFAIMDFKKSDFKYLDVLFYKAFESQLISDHLYEIGGEQYLNRFCTEIQLYQTDNDQKTLGIIRDSIYRIDSWRYNSPNRNIGLVAKYILSYQNEIPIGSLKYKNAKEMMKTELENHA